MAVDENAVVAGETGLARELVVRHGADADDGRVDIEWGAPVEFDLQMCGA